MVVPCIFLLIAVNSRSKKLRLKREEEYKKMKSMTHKQNWKYTWDIIPCGKFRNTEDTCYGYLKKLMQMMFKSITGEEIVESQSEGWTFHGCKPKGEHLSKVWNFDELVSQIQENLLSCKSYLIAKENASTSSIHKILVMQEAIEVVKSDLFWYRSRIMQLYK